MQCDHCKVRLEHIIVVVVVAGSLGARKQLFPRKLRASSPPAAVNVLERTQPTYNVQSCVCAVCAPHERTAGCLGSVCLPVAIYISSSNACPLPYISQVRKSCRCFRDS